MMTWRSVSSAGISLGFATPLKAGIGSAKALVVRKSVGRMKLRQRILIEELFLSVCAWRSFRVKMLLVEDRTKKCK